MAQKLQLKNLTRKETSLAERLIWADFKGVKFQVRYLSKATLRAILEDCQQVGYAGKGEKGRTQGIDYVKLGKKLAETLIRGWQGATPKNLANLYEIELESIDKSQWEQEIEFNLENLNEVLEKTHDLDSWLQEVATDPSLFKHPDAADLAKNSQTSQTTT